MSKDGKESNIHDVLYVPSMKSNLISLGQLLENGYSMKMEDKQLKLYDEKGRSIVKAPLTKIWPLELQRPWKTEKGEYCAWTPRNQTTSRDVCGPFEVKTIGGSPYFVSFINEYIRKIWVYIISKKSEVFEVFTKFKVRVKKESDCVISKLN